MKTRLLAASAAILVVSGCETMYEPVLIERETIYDDQGIYIYSELEESFEGERFWNFWATNNNAFPVCVGVTLGSNSSSNGHSFDGIHYVSPGQTAGVGYVYAPANFSIDSDVWNPDGNGNCR